MSDDNRPTEPIRQTPPAPPATAVGTTGGPTVGGGWNAADPFAPASAAPNVGAAFGPSTPTPTPAPVVVAPTKRSTAATLVNVVLGVAVVVAVGGVAFAAGRATAPAQTAGTGRFGGNGGGFSGNGNFAPNASGAPGRGGFGGLFAGGGGISIQGTVTAVAADSITIQLQSGQTVTIPTDSSTTYHSQAAASASDVAAGKTVIVQLSGGRIFGGGAGNGGGNGGAGNGGGANGQPNRGPGTATSITVVPAS
jgi:hypothetical protein